MPNFVNYRLGFEPVCDSGMIMSWNNFPQDLNVHLITYPTPVEDEVNLELWDRDKNINSITIMDIQGKVLKQENKQESTYKLNMDVAELSAGIYLVKVRDQYGQIHTGMLVKN